MYPHLLKIQIAMMLLVATGNCLLAGSIGDPYLAWFSIFAIVVGFLVVDQLQWINLKGWVANVLLIGVLYLTMRGFIGGTSSDKLLSVANLLAFLQLTLYFQKKTPRLCWQLVVLSILQIVLAAIFNLNFEHFFFFLLYFAVVSASLFLQHEYQSWTRTTDQNRNSYQTARDNPADIENQPAVLAPMLVVSKPTHSRYLASGVLMALPWLLVCTVFSLILFHSLPHSRQNWKGATTREFSATGRSISVNLNVDGIVQLSNQLQFRARFSDPRSGDQVIVSGQPYFRGMALSRWSIENDATHWSAPYDHVFDWSYSKLPALYANQLKDTNLRAVELEVILEPVDDPLLYATTPMFKQQRGESDVEFCREISALTRRRSETTNNIASYVYRVETLLDENNRTLNAWPYKPFRYGKRFPRLESESPEHLLYTQMEPKRYKRLVATAATIARNTNSDNPRKIAQAFLDHFSESNQYRYTLNYRDVQLDKSLDPVEDFFANHKTGHCAMYASALTLMLRSQGIPARYVVGFYGGNYNKLTDCYVIHGRNAHAWVEAYIPPEFCTQRMFDRKMAGEQSGMWLTLDPTPTVQTNDPSEALDLARSIWQDYVISPDANKQSFSSNNTLLRKSARSTMIGNYFDAAVEFVKNDRRTQWFGLAGFLLLLTLGTLRNRGLMRRKIRAANSRPANRSWFSATISAIGWVAPPLARWLERQKAATTVPFYAKLEKVLARQLDLRRAPEMTQKEFSQAAIAVLNRQSTESSIVQTAENVLQNVTDAFYQVRFSTIPLDKSTIDRIENQIQNLEQILKQTKTTK